MCDNGFRRRLNYGTAALAIACMPLLCRGQNPISYYITTVAGDNVAGNSGDGGKATAAQLNNPTGVAVSAAGTLYIVDQVNNTVRQVVAQKISTIVGTGGAGFSGDGGKATAATLNRPSSMIAAPNGDLFIADTGDNVIRKVSSGTITTFAGDTRPIFSGDNGPATSASFNYPNSLALDSAGNLYIADTQNNRIRKVTASTNIVTTIAGSNIQGYSGDGSLATIAGLNRPFGVAVDNSGNVYIADTYNNVIRKVSGNKISTVVGTGSPGFSGDGGPALKASLNHPTGIVVDPAGNIYIADTYSSRIREVINGTIYTIAGDGRARYTGDGDLALKASLNFPSGLALDSSGDLFIADTQNNVVREISGSLTTVIPPPVVNTAGVISPSAFGGFSSSAPGSWIEIYGSNLAVDARPWTLNDFQGNNAPTSLDGTRVTIAGKPCYVSYISLHQINVQIPFTVPSGPQQLVVTAPGGDSDPYILTVYDNQPELFAPALFNVGGNQYVAAQLPDGTFVAPPGAIPGVTTRQAKPGDIITVYGIGFGPVNPSIPAGQIVTQQNQLSLPLTILFGNTSTSTTYAGLAPSLVGLYQLNIVIPNVPNNDLVPLSFILGGGAGSQTLYIAVHD